MIAEDIFLTLTKVQLTMNQQIGYYLLFVITVFFVTNVESHGRLLEPPSRASMFRFKETDSELIPYKNIIQANYNDMGQNCGGRHNQMVQDGKCGVCGDPFQAEMKPHEAGGKYALGIITRKYEAGDVIDVTVEITAQHKGYFEFRLCPWNDVDTPVPQECLNRYLLSFENGDKKWDMPTDPSAATGPHNMRVKLPDDVRCEQCLFQWRYRTGNSWGTDENGLSGIGRGQQEEFYGCADIAITHNDSGTDSTTTETPVSTSTTSTDCPMGSSSNPPPSTTTTSSTATTTTTSSEIDRSETVGPSSTTTSSSQESNVPDCSRTPPGQPNCGDSTSFYLCAFGDPHPYKIDCPAGTTCSPANGHRCISP
ncbi:uncharacterized protein LOC143470595 isoform X2 [Clavelina lepadiformis]|uniref:uncharacterized protein LOC143470595 isoform X2 n=1 Tax=Clavelina lepadiformis TaxID=159417 RepID=UPI004042DE94